MCWRRAVPLTLLCMYSMSANVKWMYKYMPSRRMLQVGRSIDTLLRIQCARVCTMYVYVRLYKGAGLEELQVGSGSAKWIGNVDGTTQTAF